MADSRPFDMAPPIMTDGIIDFDFENLKSVFMALADVQRLRILNYMREDLAVTVSHLVDELELGQSQVSYHMKQLVDAGLVKREREGNFIWYSLVDDALVRLASLFRSE